jgi:hypothetical protein
VTAGKQLRQTHVRRGPINPHRLKHVIVRNDAAGRQRASLGGYGLHPATELDFMLEQAIACGAVLR